MRIYNCLSYFVFVNVCVFINVYYIATGRYQTDTSFPNTMETTVPDAMPCGSRLDHNTGRTLNAAHFGVLWKELRTLEQRVGVMEGRLTNCSCIGYPNLSSHLDSIQQVLRHGTGNMRSHIRTPDHGSGNMVPDSSSHVEIYNNELTRRKLKGTYVTTNQILDKQQQNEKYNMEIHLIQKKTNDFSHFSGSWKLQPAGYFSDEAELFSTTCYGGSGCTLLSNTLMQSGSDHMSDYADLHDTRRNAKHRKHRSARFKFSLDDREITHNLEERDTYVNNQLRGIRIRYVDKPMNCHYELMYKRITLQIMVFLLVSF